MERQQKREAWADQPPPSPKQIVEDAIRGTAVVMSLAIGLALATPNRVTATEEPDTIETQSNDTTRKANACLKQ